jgi:hypothetical protein
MLTSGWRDGKCRPANVAQAIATARQEAPHVADRIKAALWRALLAR